MTINVGDRLPEAALLRFGADGIETVALGDLLKGRSVVLFAVPGAFSTTCHVAHLPGFLRHRPDFAAKGVDEVICLAVNDPFVMQAWGEATGAAAGGITLLSDADGAFTRAMGLMFDAPAVGFYGRSRRYALHAVDGVVRVFNLEEGRGCEVSGAEAMLAALS